jgi:hypothetical protein
MQPYNMGYQPLNFNTGYSPLLNQGTDFTLGMPSNMGMPVNPANMASIVNPQATNTIGMGAGNLGTLPSYAYSPVPMTGAGGGNIGSPSLFDSFLQNRRADGSTSGGYGMAALGVAQGLGNLYLGMKQYNLAKDTLAANKEQFAKNYEAQRTTTNASLEDRQKARVASNPGAYQSVSEYMEQNRVR